MSAVSALPTRLQARSPRHLAAWAVIALAVPLSTSAAARTVRDIVLDQVAPAATVSASPANDAMAVSVLVESPDGTLTPRSTSHLFRTGERLRVKMLASRSGRVSVLNTNPSGETKLVWSGDIKLGQETITPRMVLTGQSGEDKLHVALEPAQAPTSGLVAWVGNWLQAIRTPGSRDVQLDTQNTPQATYLLQPVGQGLVTTVRVVHHR